MIVRKSSLYVFTLLFFITSAFVLSLAFPQTSLALAPYDDFSDPVIDVGKWVQYDYAREIVDGKLRMRARSSARSTSIDTVRLMFRDPSSINSIEAKITPVTFDNSDNSSNFIQIGGMFFNDGSSSDGVNGNIMAWVGFGSSNGATPTLNWMVMKATNASGSTFDLLGSGDFALPATLGTEYTLFIGWDGATFTFEVNGEEKTFNPIVKKINPANNQSMLLYTRIVGMGKEGLVEALFDDVYVNGSPYDSFSGTTISTANWITADGVYDYVRDAEEGALRMKVRTSAADTNTAPSNLVGIPGTKLPDVVQAKVTLHGYQNTNNVNLKAGISGEYYNDGAKNGWEGEVTASVFIGKTASPVAYWSIVRHTDPADPNVVDDVALGNFTTPISIGTPYTLLLGWDGAMFTFKINDEEATYKPTTKIASALHPSRRLQIRTTNSELKESLIDATFDDVMVGSSSPPKQYRLKVTASAAKKGGGVVKSDDDLISCGDGGSCVNMYTEGTPVVLEATPNEGSVFAGWTPVSLGCGTEPTCEVILSKNMSVKAKFVGPNKLKVKVGSKKGGLGTVAGNIAGLNGQTIDCPATLCENYYTLTDTVTLTAAPQGGSAFLGWKPASLGCGVNFTCDVPMNRTRSIQAVFGPQVP